MFPPLARPWEEVYSLQCMPTLFSFAGAGFLLSTADSPIAGPVVSSTTRAAGAGAAADGVVVVPTVVSVVLPIAAASFVAM